VATDGDVTEGEVTAPTRATIAVAAVDVVLLATPLVVVRTSKSAAREATTETGTGRALVPTGIGGAAAAVECGTSFPPN
jgi:hypothetical protein